jgi:hypothetical protein
LPYCDSKDLHPLFGVLGACCLGPAGSGDVRLATERSCSYYNGTWLGVGPFTECGSPDANPCGQRGTCCNHANCQCTETSVGNCGAGYSFVPCARCSDVPSPCRPNACCHNTSCACRETCGPSCNANERFLPRTSCAGNPCDPKPCCGCDWCCNQCGPGTCEDSRVYPWEILPRSGDVDKTCLTQSNCGIIDRRPNCRREEFLVEPNNAVGRHELHSAGLIRANDFAPGTPECRTYSARPTAAFAVTPGGQHAGMLCGQYNRRAASTKRYNMCYASKRPDGRHSFQCAYRVPCPEKPAVCL